MKGGVGKTAAAVNLAALSARQGLKTLLIDLDPQAASAFYLRIQPDARQKKKSLLDEPEKVHRLLRESDYTKLFLLPSVIGYRNLDLVFNDQNKPEKQLEKLIKGFLHDFDMVFIDSPPNLTLVSENILHAADLILVPVIPTPLSVMTLQKLEEFFIRKNLRLKKLAPFISMAESRKKLHRETIESLTTVSSLPFFKSVIPYSSDVERMGETRQPINISAPNSRGARAFLLLWLEIKQLLKL